MVKTFTYTAASDTCDYWPGDEKQHKAAYLYLHLATDEYRLMSAAEKHTFKFQMLEKGFTPHSSGYMSIPTCENCFQEHFCRAVRIKHEDFFLSKSQRQKVASFRNNFQSMIDKPTYTKDLYKLFINYVRERHKNTNTTMGYYSEKTFEDFLCDHSLLMIARESKTHKPIAFLMIDQHQDRFNFRCMAYDKDYMQHSPGLSCILTALQALKSFYPSGYTYLGSWSPDSPKLGYKNQFNGAESLGRNGWQHLPRHASGHQTSMPPPLSLP